MVLFKLISLNSRSTLVREKFSRLFTISDAGSLARDFFEQGAKLVIAVDLFGESALLEMTARGVFTSWATPAASKPMEDSFSAGSTATPDQCAR